MMRSEFASLTLSLSDRYEIGFHYIKVRYPAPGRNAAGDAKYNFANKRDQKYNFGSSRTLGMPVSSIQRWSALRIWATVRLRMKIPLCASRCRCCYGVTARASFKHYPTAFGMNFRNFAAVLQRRIANLDSIRAVCRQHD